jgi:CRISPR/Cas system endoribonuclease Cas6 (RAMP superfamily)
LNLRPPDLDALNFARFESCLRSHADAVLPPFLGSALRGAFGHALKAVACSMPHGDCGRCLLVERCLYPKLFETSARNGQALLAKRQNAPRPFIFVPPMAANDNGFMRARDDLLRWRVRVEAGEPVVFGLSLIGDAINDLPYVVYAISLMAQHGFGAERASFALERVAALDANGNRKLIYTSESNRIEEHASWHTTLGALVRARLKALPIANCRLPIERAAVAAASSASKMAGRAEPSESDALFRDPQAAIRNAQSTIRDEVTLRFLTPTRMRLKGRVIESPTFAQLISSLSLRLSMLAETFANASLSYDYKAMIERAHEVKTRGSTLRLMALDRYSSRRGGKLELDGFMGDVTFAGPAIQELLPLLVAGEFLNVGSGTAFGLGRYLIVANGMMPRSKAD